MNRVAHLLLVVCVFSSGVFAQAVVFDYSKLYEASSPAVVQVTTEDGSGSGFLVTPFGHIATNFHVVRGSRYLAVMTQGILSKVDASQFGPQRIDIQVGFQVDQTASCRFYVRSGGADYKDAIACS